MNNINLFVTAKEIFEQVRSSDNLPGLLVVSKFKTLLEKRFGPGGTDTHMILLYDYEINRFLLETTIDVSSFTYNDINSIEFDEMLDAFVMCIGNTFVKYHGISQSFSKEHLITCITKTLLLDFSE